MRSIRFLVAVFVERARQERKWGPQHHPSFGPDGPLPESLVARAKMLCQQQAAAGKVSWSVILNEEAYEAMGESDPRLLDKELVQTAAVAAAWSENLKHG